MCRFAENALGFSEVSQEKQEADRDATSAIYVISGALIFWSAMAKA